MGLFGDFKIKYRILNKKGGEHQIMTINKLV